MLANLDLKLTIFLHSILKSLRVWVGTLLRELSVSLLELGCDELCQGRRQALTEEGLQGLGELASQAQQHPPERPAVQASHNLCGGVLQLCQSALGPCAGTTQGTKPSYCY
jgi:hypothetical protein